MSEIMRRYFDSSASIGMHGPTDARIPWSAESLLDDMEHTGIHGALVWHWLAREYDPGYGNRVLLEETADARPSASVLGV